MPRPRKFLEAERALKEEQSKRDGTWRPPVAGPIPEEHDPNLIRLVFIGDRFYDQSGGQMAPFYTITTGLPYDYPKMKGDLERGKKIKIRKANEQEMKSAEDRLRYFKSRNQFL